jgi:hypothetical protein
MSYLEGGFVKEKLAVVSGFGVLFFSIIVSAGACDTNANSLERILNNKCNQKATRLACETCADMEFNKVIAKIESCRERLTISTENYKSAICAQRQ